MNGYLIDTNVISEYAKLQPSFTVIRWFESLESTSLFASVITLGEIEIGVQALPAGKRRSDLENWVHKGLPEWFQSNLLPVTKSIAERWAAVTILARKRGFQIDSPDGLIAATAIEHNLTLVTGNVKDFDGLGVEIFNPWTP